MTTPATPGTAAWANEPIQSKLTPEQMLTRLLELIRTSRFLSDLTAERVNRVMGVEVERVNGSSSDYSYYERFAPNWLHGFDRSTKYGRFMFSFDPVPPDSSPDMTAICDVDLDRFSSELEAMGFSKEPYYAEHGRLLHYTFKRVKDGMSEMTVVVQPAGIVEDEQTNTHRICMRMIEIF